jgi:hypothetical protein
MAKHDMEMHLVRPDFVGRTSVLQAIPGFSPVENAMEVAQRFVAYPYYVPGSMFAGVHPFGATATKMSLRDRFRMAIYRMKLRFQAKRANVIAAKIAALPAALPAAPMAVTPVPAVPPVTASGLAPAAAGKEQAALMLTAGIATRGEQLMPSSVAEPEATAGTWYYGEHGADYRGGVPFDFAERVMKRAAAHYPTAPTGMATQAWAAAHIGNQHRGTNQHWFHQRIAGNRDFTDLDAAAVQHAAWLAQYNAFKRQG